MAPPCCFLLRRQIITTQRSSSWAEIIPQRIPQRLSILDRSPRSGRKARRWRKLAWKWKPRCCPVVKCWSPAALRKMKMRPQQACKRSFTIPRPIVFLQPAPVLFPGSTTMSSCFCQTVAFFWRAGTHNRASSKTISRFISRRTYLTRMVVRRCGRDTEYRHRVCCLDQARLSHSFLRYGSTVHRTVLHRAERRAYCGFAPEFEPYAAGLLHAVSRKQDWSTFHCEIRAGDGGAGSSCSNRIQTAHCAAIICYSQATTRDRVAAAAAETDAYSLEAIS